MACFHFNVYDSRGMMDVDGTELPNIQVARIEAQRLAGDIIRDAAACGDLGDEWRVEVTDHTGLLLFRMDFMVAESPAARLALRQPTKITRASCGPC